MKCNLTVAAPGDGGVEDDDWAGDVLELSFVRLGLDEDGTEERPPTTIETIPESIQTEASGW